MDDIVVISTGDTLQDALREAARYLDRKNWRMASPVTVEVEGGSGGGVSVTVRQHYRPAPPAPPAPQPGLEDRIIELENAVRMLRGLKDYRSPDLWRSPRGYPHDRYGGK